MSLKVTTEKINKEIKLLDNYIKEYKENNYDLFYEISKLDSCWKGEDEVFFMEKIKDEKIKNSEVISSLEDLSNFYKITSSLYENIKSRK